MVSLFYNRVLRVVINWCGLTGSFSTICGYEGKPKSSILIVSKDSFKNHIERLRMIFVRLRAAGLKVNAPK